MAASRFFRRIVLDLVVWYCLPASFLLLYVGANAQPVSAIVPHLSVVAMPFAALMLARLAVSRLVPHPSLSLAISSLLVSGCIASLSVYYLFVLIGLRSWGGVVAWNVIPTFFMQGPELLDSMGIPHVLVYVLAAAVSAGLAFACRAYLRRFDWTSDLTASNRRALACFCIGCALLAGSVHRFLAAPAGDALEPVSLTLFPTAGTRNLEGHPVSPQAALARDSLEDAARAVYRGSEAAQRRNLILIVVDALRPDHMSLFGYGRDTTPNLDRLDHEGKIRKVIAHASCGDTVCGLLSLADSKFPGYFTFRPFGLHEVLRRNGYQVHLILSGDHTNFYSMRNYYGTVDSFDDGTTAQGRSLNDDQTLVDRAASLPAWNGKPTMFQFHLMSVHILRKSDATGRFQPAKTYLFSGRRDDTGKPTLTVPGAVNYYDNGVVRADAVIAQILARLQQEGYLQNALVVITSDHGESLGEHGLLGHANSVREELLRIPVVLVSFGYQPERKIDAATLPLQVDIAPTILDEFGIPPPHTWMGRPMQQRRGNSVAYFEEGTCRGLIDARGAGGPWKYWTDSRTGVEHAFDIGSDPAEIHDQLSRVPTALRGEWRSEALSERPLMTAGNVDQTP